MIPSSNEVERYNAVRRKVHEFLALIFWHRSSLDQLQNNAFIISIPGNIHIFSCSRKSNHIFHKDLMIGAVLNRENNSRRTESSTIINIRAVNGRHTQNSRTLTTLT